MRASLKDNEPNMRTTVAAQQCGLDATREAAVRLRQSGLHKDALLADRLEALSTITPAEVGGLWVPANPEHAKLGWSYDFEQTERIARAAYDSTGYDATMEVVEFVMAEADRRAATALAAKGAEMEGWKRTATEYASELHSLRSQLAGARKALGMMLKEHDILSGNFGDVMDPKHKRPDRWPTAAEAARRALEGGNNG